MTEQALNMLFASDLVGLDVLTQMDVVNDALYHADNPTAEDIRAARARITDPERY